MIRNLIQRPETQTRLSRALLLNERVAAPTLDDKIAPVIVVDDLSKDDAFTLGTIRYCFGWGSGGPVAAQYSLVGLNNALNSGANILLEKLRIFCTAATTVRLGFMPALGGGAGVEDFRDNRIAGAPAGKVWGWTQAAPGFVSPILLLFDSITVYDFLDINALIPPGFSFVVEQQTVNRTLSVNAFWREQFLD